MKVLRRTFQHFDTEENCTITPQEFGNAMERFGLNLSDGQVKAFFDRFDTDRSGLVDFDEFIRVLNADGRMDGSWVRR